MPRIEIIPDDFDENSGDGTPTFDVCADCAEDFIEGETQDRVRPFGSEVDDTDVCHPEYAGENYTCELCNKKLTEEDD